MTVDAAYIEAWLWNALGQTQTATERLDASLSSLQWSAPGKLQGTARAGALIRAMILRADIATSADPEEAARWARAVNLLWVEPEPSMEPVALRMKRIAGVTRR